MMSYQFYSSGNGDDEHDLIGILPERRKDRCRVTPESIMKWGRLAAGSYVDPSSIYFIEVELNFEDPI